MINKVTLVGNVGQVPETKTLENGATVARISIATNKSWKNDKGEWQKATSWHNCVGWRAIADQIAKITKGETVYIEGEITYREYQKDDEKRSITDINVQLIRRLNPPKADDHRMPSEDNWTEPSAKTKPAMPSATDDFASENTAAYRNLEGAPLDFN